MKISDFLSPTDVMVDVRASDKRQLLRELAEKAASALNLSADHIFSELLKREELGSTGMGRGVAIPHARIRTVKKPFGIMVRLKPSIEFNAIDSQPVDLVFVLLLPTDAKDEQLGALASVARTLRTSHATARMRQVKTPTELFSAISA